MVNLEHGNVSVDKGRSDPVGNTVHWYVYFYKAVTRDPWFILGG